jgi:Fe-S cluster assembly scaffold protein SufB
MRRLTLGDGGVAKISGDAAVSIAKGAKATIVVEPRASFALTLRVNAGEGSAVRCYMICDKAVRIALSNRVGRNAAVHNSCIYLAGAQVDVRNSLEGDGAQAYDLHAFIGRGNDAFRLDAVLRHAAHGTKGDILIKGVVKESASADLGGMIRIEKNGAGAESFLAEHILLLGPDAKARADPALEIENNDVSSRHAASVSQIDDEKIFYLMSRGLAEEAARNLIVGGFLESIIGRVDDGIWRARMLKMAEKALA